MYKSICCNVSALVRSTTHGSLLLLFLDDHLLLFRLFLFVLKQSIDRDVFLPERISFFLNADSLHSHR